MNTLDALGEADTLLRANLVRTEVLVGEVPDTPTQPYVLLAAQSPTVVRRPLAGHSHHDRGVILAMVVNNSLDGVLWLAERVRAVLDDVPLSDGRRLRYDFASPPIEEEHSGDYRWSLTADYVIHSSRSPHA